MMIKPGISELSKKVDSRYTLVSMAAKRVRMLGNDADETNDIKPISKAVEEIADGKVQYCRGEEAYDGNMTGDGSEMLFTPSEPSSDLNLEAFRYELEVAERRAAEERMEKERLEREVMEAQAGTVQE
ncbi:MAG: DNA-directed RNA polymerase subunit omega [Clostridia bacterium]|nr:DNA-directed RNA polymerase subunit omega [Clostridia bacterium]